MKHVHKFTVVAVLFTSLALLGGSASYGQGAVGTGSIGGSEDGGPVGSGSIGPSEDGGGGNGGSVDILPLSGGGAGLTVVFGPEGANGERPYFVYGTPTEIDGARVALSGHIEVGKAFVLELKPNEEDGDYLTPPYGWPKLRFFPGWDPDDAGTNNGVSMGRIYNNSHGQRLVKW